MALFMNRHAVLLAADVALLAASRRFHLRLT